MILVIIIVGQWLELLGFTNDGLACIKLLETFILVVINYNSALYRFIVQNW